MKNNLIYQPVIRQLTLTFFLLGILAFQAVAQSGRIEGRVFDGRTNEPLPFTNIIIRGTKIGTTADLDGNFIFTGVTPGFTQLMASSVGYELYTSEDFMVTNAKTTFVNLPMTSTSVDL
ncbi:MAG: carboxypeptidase-like regulatory domain-containing protein, partial [Bacteroidales bacterium]|nr:carboxypeptidase-like regulatory domain-containing protein [Bacteroidales bacterium]